MVPTQIILKPLVTEKSTFQSNETNRYAFQVERHADKAQIKRAIEELYGVRVIDVATMNRKGQLRRNKFGFWKTQEMKRAIVKVHADDRIDLF